MEEIWKDIKGYEGIYQVSNIGRVKNLKRNRIRKPAKERCGYLFIALSKNNKKKLFKIHRLVAEAFILNPDNLPQVNHKDENKENNCVDNLEWCTAKYNMNYGTAHERTAAFHRGRKRSKTTCENISKSLKGKYKYEKNPNSKRILQFTKDGVFVQEWECMQYAVEKLKISQPNISRTLTGRSKTAGGYRWEYK